MSCVNTPLRKGEELIKVHELERTPKEKEVEWLHFPDQEKHLRKEQRELLNKLEQKKI